MTPALDDDKGSYVQVDEADVSIRRGAHIRITQDLWSAASGSKPRCTWHAWVPTRCAHRTILATIADFDGALPALCCTQIKYGELDGVKITLKFQGAVERFSVELCLMQANTTSYGGVSAYDNAPDPAP
jgi:hypothetical protein